MQEGRIYRQTLNYGNGKEGDFENKSKCLNRLPGGSLILIAERPLPQSQSAPLAPHLQGILGADRQDLVLEVAELTAPGAPLADPADEAGLVRAAHGAVAAAGAQELPLEEE